MNQYPLRLSESLMKAVRKAAKKDRTSMNQFFATAIAEKLSALETESLLEERAGRADAAAFRRAMGKVPDAPVSRDEDQLG